MILAAGRGERMRPLTDHTPKPLIKVARKWLIVYHLEQLSGLGIKDVVINHAWLGEQIPAHVGNGERYSLHAQFSDESQGALETAGGIIKALPMLGSEPFLVLNGDVFVAPHLSNLPQLPEGKLAHLWLVENPDHNIAGDFSLSSGTIQNKKADSVAYTFSGIAIYHPEFFKSSLVTSESDNAINTAADGKLPLGPMLRQAADKGLVSGELLAAHWTDVGTPERLKQLEEQLVNHQLQG